MNKEYIGQISVTVDDLKGIANRRAYKETVKHIYIFLAVFILAYLPSLFLITIFVEASIYNTPLLLAITIPVFYYLIRYGIINQNKLTKTYHNKLITEVKTNRISDIVSNRHND